MHDTGKSPEARRRYPGYDVLSKRQGPSWNAQTRRVITLRLSINPQPRFFTAAEFETVAAIASRAALSFHTASPFGGIADDSRF